MVTPLEKRSNISKFCEFHNDKGHSTNEWVQLKKEIEELVRAGKLSQFVKGIRQEKDQQRPGKKDIPTKDKAASIYMIRSWTDKTLGDYRRLRNILLDAWMNFMLVRSPSPANGISDDGDQEFQAWYRFTTYRNDKFKLKMALERAKAIQAEVQKLVEAGIMREVYYHDWLSNPVLVKKHDGSWRMCVDFTDLNKACPQDCYPLPEIDWKIESLCDYPFKCFLDAYKGYHQIQMAEEDEEKTAFHTPQGVYCYTKMPFGLKNAGATYQRLVDKAFDKQVGRNLEVYVDDLVIKSHTEEELLRDIEETFRTLRKINMKLNPKKCTFGAVEGMFLGYVVGPEGIKPCPDKVDAVLQLPSPRTIKEVQSLNGKLAGLNRFLSKSAEKSLPLFKTLKNCTKKSDFFWTSDAEKAFRGLKRHLSELPTLVAPRPQEELIMYLSASHGAVGTVLMTERDTVQTPVYFISCAL
ncbi:reverse transcriptase domain-containing protein [Tanacetum coccineum]